MALAEDLPCLWGLKIVGRQQIFNINMHDDSVGAAPESSQEVFGADLYLMEIDPALHSSHEPGPRIRHFK